MRHAHWMADPASRNQEECFLVTESEDIAIHYITYIQMKLCLRSDPQVCVPEGWTVRGTQSKRSHHSKHTSAKEEEDGERNQRSTTAP